MEEWKEYIVSDLGRVVTGKTPRTSIPENYGGKIPFLTPSDDLSGKYSPKTIKTITDIGLNEVKNCLLPPKSICVSCIGSDLGKVVITEEPTVTNQQFNSIIPNDENDADYIYYLMTIVGKQLNFLSKTSTAVPIINKSTFSSFRIKLPTKTVQQQIASILSSLDDKIEVNRRINENLEAQAQALFKSWFVDFEPFRDCEFVESELGRIPKGWKVLSLDEMTSKFGTGLNPRKNFKLGEGNNYYVTIKNMGDNRIYLDDKCDKVTDEAIGKINKRSRLQAGDLLFSGIGTIGRVALIKETPTNWNTSESIFNMHPSNNISSEFLYILLLSDVFQKYVKLHAQGGVQQGIRMASLKDYKMAMPSDTILREFDKIIIPLVSLVKKNDAENDRLATLRDTLLPRLMSGELKVNEIK